MLVFLPGVLTANFRISVQRYEGGSTLYGPWTLDAFIHIHSNLVDYLADSSNTAPSPGTAPPDLTQNPLSLRVSPLIPFIRFV